MRALLTGGIKAILAIAALSTAAHWALRVQRDTPSPVAAVAGLPDPSTTGSIEPRRIDRPAPAATADFKLPDAKAADPRAAAGRLPDAKARQAAPGLDQMHLSALIASTAQDRPKVQKPAAKR